MLNAGILAHGRAASRSVVSVAVVSSTLFCHPACSIAHGLVGTYMGISNRQVENIHLCHQRNMDPPHFDTDPLLFQIAHDTAGCIQSEGASAAENCRVDPLGGCDRVQNTRLPAGRAAPADVKTGSHSCRILT